MTIQITPDIEAISAFLDQLHPSILADTPATHFPVQLPLTFPSTLHLLNFVVTLHIVEATFSHPRHAAYLAAAGITARDAALRGVMGAFLASDDADTWSADNLLSAQAWAKGKMSEEKVADLFAIEVMKERAHETLQAVKVGGRWAPGVQMAGDLVGLFKRLGEAVSSRGGRCVGDATVQALKAAQEGVQGMKGDSAHEFARIFCDKVRLQLGPFVHAYAHAQLGIGLAFVPLQMFRDIRLNVQAVHFEKSLADPYPPPSGKIIPAAPLRLLQDLAHLPSLTELGVTIPKPHDLDNISPLPLPISLIAYAGLVDTSSLSSDHSASLQSVSSTSAVSDITSLMQSGPGIQGRSIETVNLPLEVLAALQSASVEVCREVWGSARFSTDRDEEGEWKRNLSLLDVYKMGVVLEGYRWAGRKGKELVSEA